MQRERLLAGNMVCSRSALITLDTECDVVIGFGVWVLGARDKGTDGCHGNAPLRADGHTRPDELEEQVESVTRT